MKQKRILAACLLAVIMMTGCKGKDEEPTQTPMEDGQAIVTEEPEEIKESEALLQDIAAQQQGEYQGVDVSRFQGTIDWNRVKEAGMEFAMIRVGYRKESTGVIEEDSNARYNLQEATAAGIPCGVYFFSTATNEEEAREEAEFTLNLISGYAITYPVVYNCEGFADGDSRMNQLSVAERTHLADVFLSTIRSAGYTPMFYANRNELEGDAAWDTTTLENNYLMWVAWYGDESAAEPQYAGKYAMWQKTATGNIDGIPESVDIDKAYFGYSQLAVPRGEAASGATADPEALMGFHDVSEMVTAKEETNLRSLPNTGNNSVVIHTLTNGETVERTGVSDAGWSRLIYNGQKVYAVSNYLTTDTSYQAPASTPAASDSSGLKTKFTACDDYVTPKEEINLRSIPSVTDETAVVIATVPNGEVLHRTGINNEYGWSRIDYNGQTVYCISSYLTGAQ